MLPNLSAQFGLSSGASRGDDNLTGAVINSGVGSPFWNSMVSSPLPAGNSTDDLPSPPVPPLVFWGGFAVLVVALAVAVAKRKKG